MRRKQFLFFLVIALLVQGCALIINGKRQSVNFASTPSGAVLTVDGTDRGKTPALLDLNRDQSHTVKIQLEGYQPFEMKMERKVSGWVWGNILLGGIIGLIVDASTGAMYKLTPEQVNGSLVLNKVSMKQDQLSIAVLLQVDPSWEKIGQLNPAR
jgi:hypothetical protein